LWWKRHRNKLKSGHLDGNRFRIKLSGLKDAGAARVVLERLGQQGLPNYFGAQRFGASGTNAARGKAILLKGGKARRHDFERKLLLSAYQSELFNRVLARRLEGGLLGTAREGDVLKKHETGGEFVCVEPAVDQPRVALFEVSPTGPIFGPEMRAAEGEVGRDEARVLEEEGLAPGAFAGGGDETRGTRRFLRIPLGPVSFEATGGEAWLGFSLPAGSYATVLLAELLKPDRS
jgi:tRNA pseudouridine13 synthase